MEDDGGQYLISPVDLEIKVVMKRVINYFEKAHKVKATKINIKKLKKSIALWLANMSCKKEEDFSYELTNRKGQLNVWLEIIKWMLFMSNHTLVALVTAIFEKCGLKHGSEKHVRLMQQSKDLYQEFKVLLCYFFLLYDFYINTCFKCYCCKIFLYMKIYMMFYTYNIFFRIF